jgi:hypothetical protein
MSGPNRSRRRSIQFWPHRQVPNRVTTSGLFHPRRQKNAFLKPCEAHYLLRYVTRTRSHSIRKVMLALAFSPETLNQFACHWQIFDCCGGLQTQAVARCDQPAHLGPVRRLADRTRSLLSRGEARPRIVAARTRATPGAIALQNWESRLRRYFVVPGGNLEFFERRDDFLLSLRMTLRAMWRRTARLWGLLSMRFLALSSSMTTSRHRR